MHNCFLMIVVIITFHFSSAELVHKMQMLDFHRFFTMVHGRSMSSLCFGSQDGTAAYRMGEFKVAVYYVKWWRVSR